MKRMLVPTDFSAPSDIALAYAIGLAARLGTTIHLLHVLDASKLAVPYRVERQSKLFQEAAAQLEERTARCREAGIAATMEVVVGRPERAITEEAASRGIDFIVMGTHGRSGLAHLVIGSVAERVVRSAPCPVLTVRDTARVADLLAQQRIAGASPKATSR